MKLNHIQADNFLRLNLFDIDLSGDGVVHLFAGHNEAGKSSVQEAIRFAIQGETVRVSKKGDYKLMIRDGAKAGTVGVVLDDQTLIRDIKSGKLTTGEDANLPVSLQYLLDSQRFASLNQDKRRSFLIGLTGTKVKADDITRRMLAKGVDQACIDMVIPMLRSGFTATHREAQNRASESRAKWVGLTGNARYGSQIASDWKAVPPEDYDETILPGLEKEREDLMEESRLKLMDKGSVTNQIDAAKNKRSCACSECGALLRIINDRDPGTGRAIQTSELWTEDHDIDVGALTSRTVELSNELSRINVRLGELTNEIATQNAKKALFQNSEDITKRAQEHHKSVQQWEKAVEALAPDGIPAEILSDTLKPVNDRLRSTAYVTGWPQVTIDPTMEIIVDGRRYSLLSESARWRADVTIADAISHLSGLKMLIVDRMDVLDLYGRQNFMTWINTIQEEYDTILIFATLKACPSLRGMKSHWIESGEVVPPGQEDAA